MQRGREGGGGELQGPVGGRGQGEADPVVWRHHAKLAAEYAIVPTDIINFLSQAGRGQHPHQFSTYFYFLEKPSTFDEVYFPFYKYSSQSSVAFKLHSLSGSRYTRLIQRNIFIPILIESQSMVGSERSCRTVDMN